MTKEELIVKLEECASGKRDPEIDHGRADELLLEYIADLEIKAAFDKIEKWYA